MKKLTEYFKRMDKGTIIRTILVVCAFVNQILATLELTSWADSEIYRIISLVVTIVMAAVCYWYNNDWTKLALLTRDVFDLCQDGKIEEKEVQQFISDHNGDNDFFE